jgi:predicted permease
MQQITSDIRSGIRMLVKYPTLSLVSILTLGLGIGLSTTVFCVVNGALFKGLPFRDSGRVVSLIAGRPSQSQGPQPLSVQDIEVYRQREGSFEQMGAFGQTAVNLSTEEGRPERFSAGLLTVAAFEVLGVQPAIGRGFREGDDRPGAPAVIIIGHNLWLTHYGGAADIVGRTIRADGVPRQVIGVMPAGFGFPVLEDAWLPLTVDSLASTRGTGPSDLVIARLKRGASLADANAQAATIAAALAREYPETNREVHAEVVPYAKTILGPEIFALLYTMMAAGVGVLLIACVNVSNLLVARAALRRREVAVRIALGAARSRVIRQHLTEVLVLAAAGAGIGVAMSEFGMRWFTRALSANPPPFWMAFDIDYRVLVFVAGLVVLASAFAGAIPALHASRVTAGAALKDDNRSSTSATLGRFSSALVVVELAVSCGLLIAAGLMIKSVVQLKNVRMPFAIDNVLTARVDLSKQTYPNSAASIRFFEQLLPRLRAVPGVEAATLSDGLPAAGNGSVPVQVEGVSLPHPEDYPLEREGIVTEGYFTTFQTRVMSGREFTPADTATSQPVAIVNQSFARRHFPNVDPVGHQMKRIRPTKEPWMTIVGVVPDLIMQGIGNNNASPSGYYIPISQSDVGNSVRIAVRTSGSDPGAMSSLVRGVVASLDPNLAIYEIDTMQTVIARQTWFYTVFGTFFMAFGVCALFLATAGLYGVMSFAVTQRTREMGVRSALGARGTQLVALVMRRSLWQLAVGMLLGLTLAVLASGALQPVLYHVDPRDASVFAVVVGTLTLASIFASLLPARRVTKIDPVVALTVE